MSSLLKQSYPRQYRQSAASCYYLITKRCYTTNSSRQLSTDILKVFPKRYGASKFFSSNSARVRSANVCKSALVKRKESCCQKKKKTQKTFEVAKQQCEENIDANCDLQVMDLLLPTSSHVKSNRVVIASKIIRVTHLQEDEQKV